MYDESIKIYLPCDEIAEKVLDKATSLGYHTDLIDTQKSFIYLKYNGEVSYSPMEESEYFKSHPAKEVGWQAFLFDNNGFYFEINGDVYWWSAYHKTAYWYDDYYDKISSVLYGYFKKEGKKTDMYGNVMPEEEEEQNVMPELIAGKHFVKLKNSSSLYILLLDSHNKKHFCSITGSMWCSYEFNIHNIEEVFEKESRSTMGLDDNNLTRVWSNITQHTLKELEEILGYKIEIKEE